LCAIAVTKIVADVLEKNGIDGAVAGLVCGGKDVGEGVVGSTDIDMGKRTIILAWSERRINRLHSIVHRQ
jgi:hypothetical protein